MDEHARQPGLREFDNALLAKVEHTLRELGLTKNTLEVQRLFTNECVQGL
jgi:hypothetical protein